MELRFSATEIGCVEQDGVLVCGASNSKTDAGYHYFTIQAWADLEMEEEDGDGLYFEVDDQINGGYDLLSSCEVTREHITIHLLHDVPWHPGLARIVVDCKSCPDKQHHSLVTGLRLAFRDRPSDLQITA